MGIRGVYTSISRQEANTLLEGRDENDILGYILRRLVYAGGQPGARYPLDEIGPYLRDCMRSTPASNLASMTRLGFLWARYLDTHRLGLAKSRMNIARHAIKEQ